MTNPDAQVWTHYELRFRTGESVNVSVLDGRDTVGLSKDGEKMVLTLTPDDQTVETLVFASSELVYMRMVRVTPAAQVAVEDGGTIRLVQ